MSSSRENDMEFTLELSSGSGSTPPTDDNSRDGVPGRTQTSGVLSPCLGNSPDTLRLTGIGGENDIDLCADFLSANDVLVSRLYEEQNAKYLRGRRVPSVQPKKEKKCLQQKREKNCAQWKRTSRKAGLGSADMEPVNWTDSGERGQTLDFDTAQDFQSSSSSLDLQFTEMSCTADCEVISFQKESRSKAVVGTQGLPLGRESFRSTPHTSNVNPSRNRVVQKRRLQNGSVVSRAGISLFAHSEDADSCGKQCSFETREEDRMRTLSVVDETEAAGKSESYMGSQELFSSQTTNSSSTASIVSGTTQCSLSNHLDPGSGDRSRKRNNGSWIQKRKSSHVSKHEKIVKGTLDCTYKRTLRASSGFVAKHNVRKSEEAITICSAFQYLIDEAKRNIKNLSEGSQTHSQLPGRESEDFMKVFCGYFATCQPSLGLLKRLRNHSDWKEENQRATTKRHTSASDLFSSAPQETLPGSSVNLPSCSGENGKASTITVASDTEGTMEAEDLLQGSETQEHGVSGESACSRMVEAHSTQSVKLGESERADDSSNVMPDAELLQPDPAPKESQHTRENVRSEAQSNAKSVGSTIMSDKKPICSGHREAEGRTETQRDGSPLQSGNTIGDDQTSRGALPDKCFDRDRPVVPETEGFMDDDNTFPQRFSCSGEEDHRADADMNTALEPEAEVICDEHATRVLEPLDDRTVIQETEFFMEFDDSDHVDHPHEESLTVYECDMDGTVLGVRNVVDVDESADHVMTNGSEDAVSVEEFHPVEYSCRDEADHSTDGSKEDSTLVAGSAVGDGESPSQDESWNRGKAVIPETEHFMTPDDVLAEVTTATDASVCSFHGERGSTDLKVGDGTKVVSIVPSPGDTRMDDRQLVDENVITVIPDTEDFMGDDSFLGGYLHTAKKGFGREGEREEGIMRSGGGDEWKMPKQAPVQVDEEKFSAGLAEGGDGGHSQRRVGTECSAVKMVLQPSQAFQTGREEAVLALMPGLVDCVLEQPFLVILTQSSLSVWTQNTSSEWNSEVDWLIDMGSTAVEAILMPCQKAVCVSVTCQENSGRVRLWIFVYHWMTGTTNKIKVDIPLIICYRVPASTMVFPCAVGAGQLVVLTNGQGMAGGRKYGLADSLTHLAWMQAMEGCEGKLVSVTAVQGLPCLLGLTSSLHLVIWDHVAGLLLQSVHLGGVASSAEQLIFASSHKVSPTSNCPATRLALMHLYPSQTQRELLVLLASGAGAVSPGCLVLVKPISGQATAVQPLQRTDRDWAGVSQAWESEGLVLMVDRRGQAGVWSHHSGALLGVLPYATVHSAAIHTHSGLAFVASELSGCVHTYSFTAA